MLAGRDHLGAELVDRPGLLGREVCRVARLAAGQFTQFLLRPLQLLLQRALLGGVALVGGALDLLDHGEGPCRAAAAAQPDQILAAGQDLDRIGDKIGVVRKRRNDAAAEEIAALGPEAVVEHIGIGDDEDIDRLRRLAQEIG